MLSLKTHSVVTNMTLPYYSHLKNNSNMYVRCKMLTVLDLYKSQCHPSNTDDTFIIQVELDLTKIKSTDICYTFMLCKKCSQRFPAFKDTYAIILASCVACCLSVRAILVPWLLRTERRKE
jgi:hypothetical protein